MHKTYHNYNTMLFHIDSAQSNLGKQFEVLVDVDYRIIRKFTETDEPETNIFFFHKDHLGSSTQISDMGQKIIHHIEYMPTGEQFLEQRDYWHTPFKFNGKELDEETGLYYYGARYYTPEVGVWLSVDPLSDKYPSMSAFMYCAGNPVIYIDPDGRAIDETTSGYEQAKNAADPSHATYQPAFAKLFDKWKDDESINVQFISDMSDSKEPDAAGTIDYGGTDSEGRGVYKIFWDSSDETTDALGTSAMFEEAKHLQDAFDGEFSITGPKYINTQNEVEAKKWVVDNIKGIKGRYKNGDYKESTHYGYFKRNPSKLTTTNLEKGIGGLLAPNIDSRKPGRIYRLYGTGGY